MMIPTGFHVSEYKILSISHVFDNNCICIHLNDITCHLLIDKPYVSISPNQTVISSDPATFYCNATGKYQIEIIWFRHSPGSSVPSSRLWRNVTSNSSCLPSTSDPMDKCKAWSTATIPSTTFRDNGCYKCIVRYRDEHDGGTVIKMVYLTVLSKK